MSLVYFHFFEALNKVFEVQFSQGFILHILLIREFRIYLIKDTGSMWPCSSDFFKVQTLLNNAFNKSSYITCGEYKGLEIDVVTNMISVTEYHHLISRLAYGLF